MENTQVHGSKAFTLIEMVIVIVIMGLLMAVALPSYNAYRNWARRSTTKSNLAALQQAIDNYSMMTDQYPNTLEDLITQPSDPKLKNKWPGNLLKKEAIPLDGWGQEFHYQLKKGSNPPYELYSDGDPNSENPMPISIKDL
jgi:type II secretion system protein G